MAIYDSETNTFDGVPAEDYKPPVSEFKHPRAFEIILGILCIAFGSFLGMFGGWLTDILSGGFSISGLFLIVRSIYLLLKGTK